MIKVLSHGCMGKMSMASALAVNAREGMEVTAGVDLYPGPAPFPVYSSLDQVTEDFDMIVDFSVPSAVEKLCAFAALEGKALIVGTTGLEEKHYAMLREAAETVPVFASYNMHLGLYYLQEVIRESLKYFKDWDIELIEQHHNQKIDAPSGTAEIIMDMIKEAKPDTEFIFDRSSRRQARLPNEVGVSCVRSGSIVGIHHLMYGGENEYFELKHTVVDRKALSGGTAKVVAWMADKPAGYYTMPDLIASLKK